MLPTCQTLADTTEISIMSTEQIRGVIRSQSVFAYAP